MKGNYHISYFQKDQTLIKKLLQETKKFNRDKRIKLSKLYYFKHTLHVPSIRYSRPEAEAYKSGGSTRHANMSSWRRQ